MSVLNAQLERLARASRLLIGVDFDGTIAPIVDEPSAARPIEGIVDCLAALARLRQTDVAIISGRSLESLRAALGDVPHLILVGSHGAEFSEGITHDQPMTAQGEVDLLMRRLADVKPGFPGSTIERKPLGVAFHYRNVTPELAARADERARSVVADVPNVTIKPGKMVVEFAVTDANKGEALQRLRYRTGASSVLYFGDDLTDEDAFRTLADTDVGVFVGSEHHASQFGLPDPVSVLAQLKLLLEHRSAWAAATTPVPIQNHSLLSDQRSLALVGPRSEVVWLCGPRMDSPPLFSGLLGPCTGPKSGDSFSAGEFAISPCVPADAPPPSCTQAYDDDTLILRTTWPTFSVIDYLDCSAGRPFQRAGRTDLIRVIEGSGRVRIVFAPRLDYGRTTTTLSVKTAGPPKPPPTVAPPAAANPAPGVTPTNTPTASADSVGGLSVDGLADPVVLVSPGVTWRIDADGPHQTAVAELDLTPGQPLVLELRLGVSGTKPLPVPEKQRREQTRRFWSGWAASLRLPAVEPALVKRSALLLKGLVYGPTGAILAAATSSLPEWPGGVRNWDYRYCWPRDASLTAAALVRLGNTGHAMRLLDWLLAIVDQIGGAERLRPIYTVLGAELGSEADVTELAGYAASRPVRIGNSAAQQVQLDVFGPIVDLVWQLAQTGAAISPDHWRLVEAMVAAVAKRWREPDHGIWEVRGPRRHYVHSKTMCWLAIDRAIKVSDALFAQTRPEWEAIRAEIRDDVLAHGFCPKNRCFTLSYEMREHDAGCLTLGIFGLLPPTDERFIATVDAVQKHLMAGPALLRYRFDDGLPGREGGFLICLGWLIQALILLGRRDDAQKHFDALVSLAGPTGLLAEQAEPHTASGLGNVPQAYSHLALINAALALDAAGCREGT